MAKMTTSKERRDKAIVKTVERILSQAERPYFEDIIIDVNEGEAVTITYKIKEIIIPEEDIKEDQL